MATTSPDNLWSPDAPNPYNVTVDLAAMQSSVQTALTSLSNRVGTDSGWINITTFLNAFSSVPGNPARYRRIGNKVYLSGELVRNSATAPGTGAILNAFTLPAGFRPQSRGWMTTLLTWQVTVGWQPDGIVGIMSNNPRPVGASPGYPIDGIEFLID